MKYLHLHNQETADGDVCSMLAYATLKEAEVALFSAIAYDLAADEVTGSMNAVIDSKGGIYRVEAIDESRYAGGGE